MSIPVYLRLKRERDIYITLRPFLREIKTALDFQCGYSPLAPYLLMEHIGLWGFDTNHKAIRALRVQFPQAHWAECKGADYQFPCEVLDLLVWLGVSGDNGSVFSFLRIIDDKDPCLILLEFSRAFSKAVRFVQRVDEHLIAHGYELQARGTTTFGFAQRFPFEHAGRVFRIYLSTQSPSCAERVAVEADDDKKPCVVNEHT